MSIPAAILRATLDPELHAKDIHVLLWLWTMLDANEYTPAKGWWLKRKLGISQPEACRALRRLRTRGFIEAGPRIGAANTYRLSLPYAQPEDKAA